MSVPLSLWWAYALWTGRSWAFSWAFMLTALCAVLLVGVVLVQILLLEMSVPAGVWWSLFASWLWLFLLIQPETKRFAGLIQEKQPGEELTAGG
ncbi:MAG TPA: hypothetical protein VNP73_06860 [Actinomycetota bacterium]|nr:hypothetical protein [Actinomycetota bacterium]